MAQLYPVPSNTDTAGEEDLNIEIAQDILNSIASGATLKDICGIPADIMDAIYAHAYDMYQKGLIDDARIFFEFLCMHDIYNADYMMGMAAVLQQKKDYFKAVQMYTLSHVLNNQNLRAKFYAGQCWLFLGDKLKAKECFTVVVENDAPDTLKKQARAYLAALQTVAA